jgi:8-oxo-dGTP pyrophosphatase MutT (NUDIX family)
MRSRALNNTSTGMQKDQHEIFTLPSSVVSSYSSLNQSTIRNLTFQRNILLVVCIVLPILFISYNTVVVYYNPALGSSSSSSKEATKNNASCEISLGKYKGPVYHSVDSGTIGEPKCLLDSKWIKVSLHTVKFPGSDTTYDDWMWIDYHDRINVLVEDETTTTNGEKLSGKGEQQDEDDEEEERRFLVFEQTKYALEGKKSLAIIGGIIEPGEDPETAARREVEEEMNGLVCKNFHFLGRYRTDVNRGMGWLNGFLATQCTRNNNNNNSEQKNKDQDFIDNEIGAADTEKQKLVSLTLPELRKALAQGKFLEVQWTATVSQALHHPELTS